MQMKIVQVGEPVLRQQAKALSPAEIQKRETRQLIERMRDTMYQAPGVGLAAPQIGLPLQIAVIEDKSDYMKEVSVESLRQRERQPVPFHVIINPKIILLGEAEVEFFEGCLSLAGFTAVVPRVRKVRVDCLDHKGRARTIEATGWYARILQHEIDHLQGTLYIDRMQPRSFMGMENFNLHWKDKAISEAQRLLGQE